MAKNNGGTPEMEMNFIFKAYNFQSTHFFLNLSASSISISYNSVSHLKYETTYKQELSARKDDKWLNPFFLRDRRIKSVLFISNCRV